MAITVTCSNCLSEYNVRETNAGKKFACKQCGEMCSVPRQNKSPKPRPSSSRSSRSEPRRRKPQEYEDGYDEYDDYGADEYDEYADDDYSSSRRSKPARKARKKKKKPRRSSGLIESGDGIFDTYVNNAALWIGIPFAISLVVAAVTVVVPIGGFFAFILVLIVGGLVSFCSGIHSLVLAFQEDVACGLMILFVPFYGLYYLVTRWEEQRGAFIMQLSMCFAIVLALGALAIGET